MKDSEETVARARGCIGARFRPHGRDPRFGLDCVAEMLENEVLFLHYFAERFHFQKQFDLLGDELDFLGLYLSTGFNLGAIPPLNRKATVGFFVYPETEKADRRSKMEELAAEALKPGP